MKSRRLQKFGKGSDLLVITDLILAVIFQKNNYGTIFQNLSFEFPQKTKMIMQLDQVPK